MNTTSARWLIVTILFCIAGAVAYNALRPAPLMLAGKRVELSMQWVGADTLRLRLIYIKDSYSEDGPFLIDQQPASDALRTRFARGETLAHNGLTARFSSKEWSVTVTDSDGNTLQYLRIDESHQTLQFALGAGPLLGLGEGGAQFDRRGVNDGMRYGRSSGLGMREMGARIPVPFLIGTEGWGIYFNTPPGALNLQGENGIFTPNKKENTALLPLDLFIVASRDPATIMKAQSMITGAPSLPPLWSLGYQQSHRTLGTPEEILAEAKLFRERQLPVDMFIYLSNGYCPRGWNLGNGNFNWNPKSFPDPEAMLAALHAEHLKVSVHVAKAPKSLTGRVSDTKVDPDDRMQVANYWNYHRTILDAGVDGFWPDEGEDLPDASRLARIRMYFEGLRQERPNERSYALYRTGVPGMQRFGGWIWSGDVNSSWELLARQVPLGINTSLSGLTFWGTDTGGFFTTRELTGELYTRWFQFSAFTPLFRSHGRTWKLKTPYGWGDKDFGPVEDSPNSLPPRSELGNPNVELITRDYLNLRYRLMPYLYSLVWEAHTTGMPIMRALWLHYPDDAKAAARGDEYLWGRDMLVAPVTEKGATERTLYLPAGRWFDFWTNEATDGGREVVKKVDLATMPLYVRAGAIIPMGPVEQYTAEKPNDPLALTVYPGADGSFLLVEDDGVSAEPAPTQRMEIALKWNDATRRLSISLAPGSQMLPPATRHIEVKLAGQELTKTATFSGTAVELAF